MKRTCERALVIGGAGFIGSHFVDRLVNDGVSVTVFDNLSGGSNSWLEAHKGKPNYRFCYGDLLNREDLSNALQDQQVVFYLGGNSNIPAGATQTSMHLDINVYGMYYLLEEMRNSSVTDLIFASSNTVYGEMGKDVLREDSGPLLPVSLFGASKLACEGIISAYCHLFGIRAWICRLGNVIGGRMSRGVIHDFIAKLFADPTSLEVLGDGSQTRSFVLVDDVIDGMLHAYNYADISNEHPCDVFNISSEDILNMRDVAEAVTQAMNLADVKIHHRGGDRGWKGDIRKVKLDVQKMKDLGWAAKCHSMDAVRISAERMVSFMKEQSNVAI